MSSKLNVGACWAPISTFFCVFCKLIFIEIMKNEVLFSFVFWIWFLWEYSLPNFYLSSARICYTGATHRHRNSSRTFSKNPLVRNQNGLFYCGWEIIVWKLILVWMLRVGVRSVRLIKSLWLPCVQSANQFLSRTFFYAVVVNFKKIYNLKMIIF